MNRRRFSADLLGALGASFLIPDVIAGSRVWDPGRAPGSPSGTWDRSGGEESQEMPRINASRLHRRLEELSHYGRRPDGGVDRVAFSQAEIEARTYVRSLREEEGLDVRLDAAGNLLGRRDGREAGLTPLMVGSHLDSVPAGGNYDGPLGTLGALEVLQTLREAGMVSRHSLEVVAFVNEEGGKTGSRVMAGEFRPEELELETVSGLTIREGIRRLGGNPEAVTTARREPGSVAGFLELHVEQGAVLEEAGATIGVVEGIVGIRRWHVKVAGAANHAGTTPMALRKDALLGAAVFVQAVNRVARTIPGSQVATVGRIQAFPGAPNVIPGEVILSLEIRDLAMEGIERVFELLRREADEIEGHHGTPFTMEEIYLSAAAPTDERFRRWVEDAAQELGLSHRRMPSGAGHDAQAVAHFAPVGMIFIPSVGGVSHHPDEYSRPEDVEAGVNVLLRALVKADAELG